MKLESVLSYTGTVLETAGILSIIPVFISWFLGDKMEIPFLITAAVAFGLGVLLDKKLKKSELNLSSAMVVAAVSFILISIIGMIPFLHFMQPIDALFESVSGFTTTGYSLLTPDMPLTLFFWKSFVHWIGGIGILLIFLVMSGFVGLSSHHLYRTEGGEKIEASVRTTIRKIFTIYGIYTIVGIALFLLLGFSPLNSIMTTFSAISSGGFMPQSAETIFATPWADVVVILLMVLGTTPFFVHDNILRGKISYYFKNPEIRLFWALVIIFGVLVTLTFGQAIREGIFYTFSALTTTGFNLGTAIPQNTQALLIILMIIGGCAGSTAGGLKLVRSGIIGKSIGWMLKKMALPSEAIVPLKFGDRVVRENELTTIYIYTGLFFVVLGVSTLILIGLGLGPTAALFQATSAQSTTGLTTIDLATLNPIGKGVMIVQMLLGRLEIFPFLLLVYAIIKRGKI